MVNIVSMLETASLSKKKRYKILICKFTETSVNRMVQIIEN
jgi:hypothetical protein